jgi:hypothetical protein
MWRVSGLEGRAFAMRSAGFFLILATVALGGCDVTKVARTDQPLGEYLGVDAWMDPSLYPLRGCEALDGTWRNTGSEMEDSGISESIFAAASGFAEKVPDAVFADRLKMSPTADGSLGIEFFDQELRLAYRKLTAADLDCSNPAYAQLRGDQSVRLSVDTDGALWAGRHRFLPLAATVRTCPKVGFWTQSAPPGMATVIPGGVAVLAEPLDNQQLILTRQAVHGVKVPVQGIFLREGPQRVVARVSGKPESQWQWTVPHVTGEISNTLEACHVYVALGLPVSPTEAQLSLFDLGEDFDWRSCPLPGSPTYARMIDDGAELRVKETCFVPTDKAAWDEREKRNRTFKAMQQVSLSMPLSETVE